MLAYRDQRIQRVRRIVWSILRLNLVHFASMVSGIGYFFLLIGCASMSAKSVPADSYLWLEEVRSEKSLQWVRGQNAKTLESLQRRDDFQSTEGEIRKIFLAKDRLPTPSLKNKMIYNFWQDAQHVKGIWRRTSVEDYENAMPKWEVVLDLDLLNKQEKENWVFKGAECLGPKYERCLLKLSRGGQDASVIREFDLKTKAFVSKGFNLPEGKNRAVWYDKDSLFVEVGLNSGELTTSGYPRKIRYLKRNQEIRDAPVVLEVAPESVAASAMILERPGSTPVVLLVDQKTFFTSIMFVFDERRELKKVNLPDDMTLEGNLGDELFFQTHSQVEIANKKLQSGTVFTESLSEVSKAADEMKIEVIFQPDDKTSFASLATNRDSAFLILNSHVMGKVLRFKKNVDGNRFAKNKRTGMQTSISGVESQWYSEVVEIPENGDIDLATSNPFEERVYLMYRSFLVPSTLYRLESSKLTKIKTAPSRFNEAMFETHQYEAISQDGTVIPYFIIHKKGMVLDGTNPTIQTGYGGFEISMSPFYLGATGKVWLEKGGVYVVANIRGGGEFGPKWHKAALKENRMRAFEDFIAVSEDLISRKFTSPRHLAIQGGSNGGLLVGSVFVLRPDLYQGVICQVPLLDMYRYHKLLAGASWTGEYGNPDDPKDAAAFAVIQRYSPYQNVRAGVRYPQVLFMTSTADDRVHPGHARKMAARMIEQGHPIWYYENIEGGHGGAADLEQHIKMSTIEFEYLYDRLF